MRRLPDSGVGSDDGFDSQADSQLRERRRTVTDVSGRLKRRFDLGWTSADGSGCEKPGLQNRGEWTWVCVMSERSSYSNAGGKLYDLAALSGTSRIRVAISERATAIC